MDWQTLSNEAQHLAAVYIWNEIIHSWIDPLFLTAILVTICYAGYRFVRWAGDL